MNMEATERFVRGQGRYVGDIELPGTLHLAIIRSKYARARLLRVEGGISGRDLSAVIPDVGEGARGESWKIKQPVFATGQVNYLGQPVAAVYADNRYLAEDLMDSVDVSYEPMQPVLDEQEAMTAEPIHPGLNSNVATDQFIGKDFEEKDAEVVLDDAFKIGRIATDPIETRGILVNYDGSRLNVWVSTQAMFSIRNGLCATLGLPITSVRVMQADTGGAFGSKSAMYPEYAIAAFVSMKTRRPVKWLESRKEHLTASRPGRGVSGSMKLFAKRDGTVIGLKGEIIVNGGAYLDGLARFSPMFIGMQLTGPYAIRNGYIRAISVVTNTPPLGPYRGAGRPEAAFFRERMMDLLADELKLDPAEIRIKNATDQVFTNPFGMRIIGSRQFMTEAFDSLEYYKLAREPNGRRGVGISCFVLVPALMEGESCKLKVDNGRIKAWLGGNSHGQAHEVFVRKLIGSTLDVSTGVVDVQPGDTDMITSGVGVWGSRSAIVAGYATVLASQTLKEKVVKTKGLYTPEYLLAGNYEAEVLNEKFDDPSLNSFGANLVTVEVDELGEVTVEECRSYYDVGNALNREMVKGQITGGMAQGISTVLYEGLIFAKDGTLLTDSIASAGVPPARELPHFVTDIAEHPSNLPHGAKGVGEAPTIGVPPALVRAIEKATGVRIRNIPLHPEVLIGPEK